MIMSATPIAIPNLEFVGKWVEYNQTRNALQSLAYSPLGIVVLLLVNLYYKDRTGWLSVRVTSACDWSTRSAGQATGQAAAARPPLSHSSRKLA